MTPKKSKKKPELLGMATLTTKGQITIPKSIRTMLDLKQGDTIAFIHLVDNSIHWQKLEPEVETLFIRKITVEDLIQP